MKRTTTGGGSVEGKDWEEGEGDEEGEAGELYLLIVVVAYT